MERGDWCFMHISLSGAELCAVNTEAESPQHGFQRTQRPHCFWSGWEKRLLDPAPPWTFKSNSWRERSSKAGPQGAIWSLMCNPKTPVSSLKYIWYALQHTCEDEWTGAQILILVHLAIDKQICCVTEAWKRPFKTHKQRLSVCWHNNVRLYSAVSLVLWQSTCKHSTPAPSLAVGAPQIPQHHGRITMRVLGGISSPG